MKFTNSRYYFQFGSLVLLFFTSHTFFAQSQEAVQKLSQNELSIIGNGQSNAASANQSCTFPLPSPLTTLPAKELWSSALYTDGRETPLVGDVTGDGIPDVIVDDSRFYVYILNGQTGAIDHSIYIGYRLRLFNSSNAIADVDHDGYGEIFLLTDNRQWVRLDFDGTNWTKVMSGNTVKAPGIAFLPGLADFNGDGEVELYSGTQIWRSDFENNAGDLLAEATMSYHTSYPYPGASVAMDILPAGACANCEGLELVQSGKIFSVNLGTGTLQLEREADGLGAVIYPEEATSIADMDGDGDLDIVYTVYGSNGSGSRLIIWDGQTNNVILDTQIFNQYTRAGRINVADFDGDGYPEMGVVHRVSGSSHARYTVFDDLISQPTLTVLWQFNVKDYSGITASSAYDFNGDGAYEILYRDEAALRILNGSDGRELYSTPCISGAYWEYPVVADVQGNGGANILCTCQGTGVVALESDGDPWIPARSVWNQHGYNVTNVNDDLTIPQVPRDNVNTAAGAFNQFLTQTAKLDSSGIPIPYTAPDVSITSGVINGNTCIIGGTAVITLKNSGTKYLPSQTAITFYDGNPESINATILGTASLGNKLSVNDSTSLSFALTAPPTRDVYAVANDPGTESLPYTISSAFPVSGIAECDYLNNVFVIPVTLSPAPEVDAGEDMSICSGLSVPLSATGAQSYIWTPSASLSDPNIANPVASPASTTTYQVIGTAVNGCTDTATLTVHVGATITLAVSADETICEGDSAQLSASGAFTYSWSPIDGLSDPFSANPKASPTTSTTYTVTGSVGPGCDDSQSLTISVIPKDTTTNEVAICAGESHTEGSSVYTDSGTYFDTYSNVAGCDSVITTILTVHPVHARTNEVAICEGDSYTEGSSTYTDPGTYIDTLANAFGCDSVVTTRLTVHPVHARTNEVAICEGDAYTEGSSVYRESGTYTDTYLNAFGCDSVVTTRLTVHPVHAQTNEVAICEGDAYTEGSSVYRESGTYTDTYRNSFGCDSVITTRLTVHPVHARTNEVAICEGDAYTEGSSVYRESGTYTDTYLNAFGCDSVVTTRLTVHPVHARTNEVAICEGDAYTEGSSVYRESGTYTDTYRNAFGCDSVITTRLTVHPVHAWTNEVAICEGDSYTEGSSVYRESGTYTDTYRNAFGCDSVVTTRLTVHPVHARTNEVAICEGDSYAEGASVYTQSGTYLDTLQNVFGCDSVVTTILEVNPVHAQTNEVVICEGDAYTEGSSVYTDAGTYTDVYPNAFGCDSVVTTILEVNPVHAQTNEVVICEGDAYTEGSSVYTDAGTYLDTLQNIFGCDSVITTILEVNPVHATTNEVVICEGDSHAEGGSVYRETGTYLDTLLNAFGCDSVITTLLQVNPVHTTTNEVVICEGDSYTEGTSVYTDAGTYLDTLQNAFSCDSVVTTILEVNPVHAQTNEVVICEGDAYTEGSSVYTDAGTYTDIYPNSFGCDSVVTTILQVNPVHATTNEVVICEGDAYTEGSSVYWNRGTYLDTLQNAFGCDSIVITILEVNPVHATTNEVVICEGDSYAEGTSVYTEAGTYLDTLQNAFSCDSVVTTILKVNPIHATTNEVAICEGDSHIEGSSVYTDAGTYMDVYPNSFGCDSVVTTILKVNPVYSVTHEVAICEGDSYTEGTSVYTTSGTYKDTYQSIRGCDSVVTTILKVNPVYFLTNEVAICEGESYSEGSSVYTTPGTYRDTYQSIAGCDSLITTILTVNPIRGKRHDVPICEGESVTLSTSKGGDYVWSTGDMGPSIVVSPTNHTTYTVFDISNQGCESEGESFEVRVLPIPIAQFFPVDTIGANPTGMAFENQSLYATYYDWEFGNGETSKAEDPVIYFDGVGSYEVILIASNELSCADTTSRMIEIRPVLHWVPTSFSPNGDGTNDHFRLAFSDMVSAAHIEIFNQRGRLIFETRDMDFTWDGTYNGESLPEGVLVCRITYWDIKQRVYETANTILLIR